MGTLTARALAVWCTVCLPSCLFAQLEKRFEPLENPTLLRNEAVRRELRLSASQEARIVRKWMAWKASVEMPLPMRNGYVDTRMVERRNSYEQKLAKSTLTVLTAAQRRRLRQIEIQLLTPLHLDHPVVAKLIGLSSKQRKAIDRISASCVRAVIKGDDRLSTLAKARKAAWAVLTPAQKDKLRAISGAKVDTERLRKGKMILANPPSSVRK